MVFYKKKKTERTVLKRHRMLENGKGDSFRHHHKPREPQRAWGLYFSHCQLVSRCTVSR